MKPGDVVRNRNAHKSMNNSRGVFLGMVTYVDQHYPRHVGGVVEEEFYICAKVLWYGESKPRTIQTNLIHVEAENESW
jgi:hypothetical protein